MYESFYGLTCEPFSVAADPRFIYLSPNHRQARAHFRHGLRRGAGFLLLSGEIGAGKTTVCRLFLQELPEAVDVAFVVNPRLDARALLTRVCEDLRIDLPSGTVDLIDLIHGHLLLAHAAGRRTLIVVDEAQALSFDVLEQLRLLTNLDATGSKLQVFLIGQPELRTQLRDPALEAVSQRVVARYHLAALDEDQTAHYVAHRMQVAGLTGPLPFDDQALKAVHRLTGGVPRRINVLCDQALLAGEATRSWTITQAMLEQVAAAAFDDAAPTAPRDAAAQLSAAPAGSAARLPVTFVQNRTRWPRYFAAAAAGLVIGALLSRDRLSNAITRVAASPLPDALAMRPSSAPGEAADDSGPPSNSTAASAILREASTPAAPPAQAVPTTQTLTAMQAPATQAVPTAQASILTPTASAVPSAPTPLARAIAPILAASVPAATTRTTTSASVDAVFAAGSSDEAPAWRSLAHLWGVKLGPGPACISAALVGLRCFKTTGGPATIRPLGRPGILKLESNDGRVAYVLLVGLTDSTATFRSETGQLSLPLASLAGRWHGEFDTLWRAPPDYRPGETALESGPLALWMNERLALVSGAPAAAKLAGAAAGASAGAAPGTASAAARNGASAAASHDEPLSARVAAFQLAHGLQPDGLPGPLTLMQLNRDSGIEEPAIALAPP